MRRAALVAALVATLLLPGCLGTPSAANVPQEALSENNWRESDRVQESIAYGFAEQITIDYRPRGGIEGLSAGVTVVSVTDVPLVNEKDFIPQALEQIEKEKGVEFERIGTRTLNMVNFGSLEGDEYRVSSSGVDGRALIVTPPCGDFVITVAFGALQDGGGGGILGGSSGGQSYEDARRVASHVVC